MSPASRSPAVRRASRRGFPLFTLSFQSSTSTASGLSALLAARRLLFSASAIAAVSRLETFSDSRASRRRSRRIPARRVLSPSARAPGGTRRRTLLGSTSAPAASNRLPTPTSAEADPFPSTTSATTASHISAASDEDANSDSTRPCTNATAPGTSPRSRTSASRAARHDPSRPRRNTRSRRKRRSCPSIASSAFSTSYLAPSAFKNAPNPSGSNSIVSGTLRSSSALCAPVGSASNSARRYACHASRSPRAPVASARSRSLASTTSNPSP